MFSLKDKLTGDIVKMFPADLVAQLASRAHAAKRSDFEACSEAGIETLMLGNRLAYATPYAIFMLAFSMGYFYGNLRENYEVSYVPEDTSNPDS